MTSDPALHKFLEQQVVQRFMRYSVMDTTSDEEETTSPSSEKQWKMAGLLVEELKELGLSDILLDDNCYVYATLPAKSGAKEDALAFCAHMDTSPTVSGKDVRPIVHEKYDGGVIRFSEDSDLVLDPEECPELLYYKGQSIITASGRTLLGADDKAGIAEIMTVLAALQQFPQWAHPELRIVFTPDEEVGRGTEHIDTSRLAPIGYTLDGAGEGIIDSECFHALKATVVFHGLNVHPGQAKNAMVNAAHIASRFMASLPEHDSPEHSEGREGFYHLRTIQGDESRAELVFLLRDFDPKENDRRVDLLKKMRTLFLSRHPGLRIDLQVEEQYRNMGEILLEQSKSLEVAKEAMRLTGLSPEYMPVRGGTDGARLSFMGMPCPNLSNGGYMFHSKKEWAAVPAMVNACMVMLHLCGLYAKKEKRRGESRAG